MTINLSARAYRLTVGGLVCTAAMVSFDGADSKWEPTSGLVTFSGSVTLKKIQGMESLDDRINSRWDRGQPVLLEIANTAGVLQQPPRGASLFIVSSAFDGSVLTLEVADALALLNFKEPIGDKSGICLGEETSKTNLINRLLLAAGAPALIDQVPGTLNYPAPKLINSSYVQQAGQVAASSGYFLWVDNQNRVRASTLSTTAPPAFTINVTPQTAYRQRLNGENPPERVTVIGKAVIVRQTTDRTETQTVEYVTASSVGGSSNTPAVGRDVLFIDEFDRVNKRRVVQTWEKELLGVLLPDQYPGSMQQVTSEYKKEVYQYETDNRLYNPDGECEKGNQGRLIKHTIERRRLVGEVLREIILTFPPGAYSGILQLMIAELIETVYEYELVPAIVVDPVDPLADPPPRLGTGPRITVRKKQPIGALLPEEFAYDPNAVTSGEMNLVTSEYSQQFWKEINFGEWEQYDRVQKSLCVAYPSISDALRARLQGTSYSLTQFTRLVTTTNTRTTSNSGKTQPPAPDVYSPNHTKEEKAVRGVVLMPGRSGAQSLRQWQREFNFEYFSSVGANQQGVVATVQDEAKRLARLIGAVLWGRYKQTAYTTNYSDSWLNYTPLCRINTTEDTGEFAHWGDGFAIALSRNRCAVSSDSILLGQIANGGIVPLYSTVVTSQATGGGAVQTKLLPYAIGNVGAITAQAAGGGAVQTELAQNAAPSSSMILNLSGILNSSLEMWVYYSSTPPPSDLAGLTRNRYVYETDFTDTLDITALYTTNGIGYYVLAIYFSGDSFFWGDNSVSISSGTATVDSGGLTDSNYFTSSSSVKWVYVETGDQQLLIDVNIFSS